MWNLSGIIIWSLFFDGKRGYNIWYLYEYFFKNVITKTYKKYKKNNGITCYKWKAGRTLEIFSRWNSENIEHKLNEQNTKIEELKSKLAIKQIAIDKLEIKCDGSERYSRRSSLRIHGLDFDSDEDNNVMEKLEKSYRHMGIEFNRNEMDRARYISKSFIDKKEKRKVRSIIIKFRSWGSRTTFYKARPKNHSDWQKKPGSSFNVFYRFN